MPHAVKLGFAMTTARALEVFGPTKPTQLFLTDFLGTKLLLKLQKTEGFLSANLVINRQIQIFWQNSSLIRGFDTQEISDYLDIPPDHSLQSFRREFGKRRYHELFFQYKKELLMVKTWP